MLVLSEPFYCEQMTTSNDLFYIGMVLPDIKTWKPCHKTKLQEKYKTSTIRKITNDAIYSENEEQARVEADFYAKEIGRLPVVLRKDLETVWIHQGVELFGGGNNNILIHTGQSVNYINDGILEETLVHEAAHIFRRAHA